MMCFAPLWNAVSNSFVAYFPYCEKIKRSFSDHIAVCIYVSFSVYVIAGRTAEETLLPTLNRFIFYAVCVVSKESRQLVLPRTCVYMWKMWRSAVFDVLGRWSVELQYWARWIRSITPRFILSKTQLDITLPPMFTSLGLPSGLFPTKTLYAFLFFMHATCYPISSSLNWSFYS
jgi:hypothetical protein